MTSPITTHILDLALGQPAAEVGVVLLYQSGSDQWTELAQGQTDADGRIKSWPGPAFPLETGIYRLDFATAGYFERTATLTFYPAVSIQFRVVDPSAHYHVPLLLSPFGYSTYRGS